MTKRPSTASSRLESGGWRLYSKPDYTVRYPSPDPQDPFAPLWVLRSRQAGSSSQLSLDDDSVCDSPCPSTPEKEEMVKSKPKRPWHKIKYRRSSDQKLAQTQDPEPPIRRPKSLPPRRFPSKQPVEPLPLIKTSASNSPSLNGYGNLQSYLQVNGGQALLDMDAGHFLTRGSSCDSGLCSRSSSPQGRYKASREQSSPTIASSKSSKKGFALARLIRSRKSSTTLPPPATPSPTLSSPSHPPTPVEYELTHALDSKSLKSRRPSTPGSVATVASSTLMSSFEPADLPVRRNSIRQLDVCYHPSLADVQRSPSCQSRASLDPSCSLRRRNAKLRKIPPRPQTSPGRTSETRQASTPPPPLPLPCDETACEIPPDLNFDESALPSESQLKDVASMTIIAENGSRVRFGDIWEKKRTIVCFIRHFWCPFCQDYVASIMEHANPAVLKKANVNLIIISNGSHALIKSYRQIFNTPFRIYTDPAHRLYAALGMTLRTLDAGKDEMRGKYIKHGVMGGIARVVLNALKVGMPVWEKGGDVAQLGGEFVLGPGLKCAYAHRMRTTRGHSPITEVLAAGGADVFARIQRESVTAGQRSMYTMSQDQETKWLENRKRSFSRLQNLKDQRRLGVMPAGEKTRRVESPVDNSVISEEEEGNTVCERSIRQSRIWEAALDGPRHVAKRH